MKVSVIIPNYNGEELLKEKLDKVLTVLSYASKEVRIQIELIIIDDASTDNSIEFIESFIAKTGNTIPIYLLKNEKNLGFSPTINKAVKKANGEVVYLMNSDVCPDKDFLQYIIPHFSDPKIFAVGSMDRSIENGKTILRGRGIGKWERGFLAHRRGEVDRHDTLWVNGGSGAFRKSVWEVLGGFNELYKPYYWEDIDLSYRAKKSGYKIYFERESTVVHKHEEGAIKKTQRKSLVKTVAYRNQILFVWMNVTDGRFLLSHIVWMPYHILNALRHGEYSFIKGLLWAFFLFSKSIQSRLINTGLFIKSDKEVIALEE